MGTISVAQSGAFIEQFSLPATGDGPLRGLRFAVKDLIDVAGYRTGGGNPTWRETHLPAAVSAVCVEQLLSAGARCDGKTITDELAFSLLGENHFYGTPLNPAAPERVPGGSSSGSASAVACGLVDFALGTDTGGSVRVPASNCGVWGWRPTHGRVSLDGVMPLAPSFDTVGVLARRVDILRQAAGVLLGNEGGELVLGGTVHLVAEAFDLVDAHVRDALGLAVECISDVFGGRVRRTSLAEISEDASAGELSNWLDIYRVLMAAEVDSMHCEWVAATRPKFGPATAAGFEFVRSIDRGRVGSATGRREQLSGELQRGVKRGDLLCMPTAPTVAPLKGATSYDRSGDYYRRTLSMTSVAGVGRLPQLSMPMGNVGGAPVGVSLLGGFGEDLFLLNVAGEIERHWSADGRTTSRAGI